MAAVSRDNEDAGIVVSGSMRLADIEAVAKITPDHDWRVHIDAPLYSATYQRQGKAEWVLVEKGQGFA
jgi:hypothetical protein